jgi:hypothetical protein
MAADTGAPPATLNTSTGSN